jgi:hypothetical protein
MEWGSLLRRARRRSRASGGRAAGALLVAIALAPATALAQVDTDFAIVRGEILDTMVVENEADLDFGDLVPGTANGTVVLTPSATPTCTTNNGIVHTGNCRAARFDGSASFLFFLRVTKPPGNQVTLTGPMGATMVVNNLSYAMTTPNIPFGSTATEQRYWLFAADFTLYVGGTLNVASNQRPGIYNGTFTLEFNYD